MSKEKQTFFVHFNVATETAVLRIKYDGGKANTMHSFYDVLRTSLTMVFCSLVKW